MEHLIRLDGLLEEFCAITALSDASALVRRAARVADVSVDRDLQVQQLAEAIAMSAARADVARVEVM